MGKTRSVMLETDDGRWELPVNPKEISVTQDSKDKTIDLLNVGEFNVPGNRGLIKIVLSTFLPDSSSPFYKGVDPEQVISSIKKAKNGKRPIRIIISGSDVNAQFTVSSATETYKEGQTDIYVSWSFVENRDLNTQPVASWVKRYTETGICERNTKASIPKTVTAKAGDSLWNLACRYYGDGSRWKDIAAANGMTDDSLAGGERLVIPD